MRIIPSIGVAATVTMRHLALIIATSAVAPRLAAQDILPDSAILAIIRARVDGGQHKGIAVGWVARDGRSRILTYGPQAGVRPFDAGTVFEIGSITKTFTTAILADMVLRGEVALDDPVQRFLPPDVKVPERAGKQITLLDLATQTSGLPRLPGNFAPANVSNPYADYSVRQMYDFLSSYTLPRDIGAQYEYSNIGVGLLGHALSLRAGMSYEQLVTERVLAPLAMTDTRIALDDDLRLRLAPGHNEGGFPVPLWDLPTIAGSGALRSTMADMVRYLRANIDSAASPLGAVLAMTHAERRPTESPNRRIGLAWQTSHVPSGKAIVWHNGGTGGYRSWAGFDPENGFGVVVLTNSSLSVDDIGRHLIDQSIPLTPVPATRAEVELPVEVLERYVGEYEFAATMTIAISRAGASMFAQPTGQPRVPIFAESDTGFFLKVVDAQLTFVRDSSGAVIEMLLHQAGRVQRGRRK